jgi:hypothetical protein
MDRSKIPFPIGKNIARKAKADKTGSASKYPQGYFKPKPCRWCSDAFEPTAPSELYCSDNCSEQALSDAYIHRAYGISLENYRDLYIEQDGKCYICSSTGFKIEPNSGTDLAIDHCHETGKVRGLLCHNCNRALGLLKDNLNYLNRAKEYLTKPDIQFTSEESNIRTKRIRS